MREVKAGESLGAVVNFLTFVLCILCVTACGSYMLAFTASISLHKHTSHYRHVIVLFTSSCSSYSIETNTDKG